MLIYSTDALSTKEIVGRISTSQSNKYNHIVLHKTLTLKVKADWFLSSSRELGQTPRHKSAGPPWLIVVFVFGVRFTKLPKNCAVK